MIGVAETYAVAVLDRFTGGALDLGPNGPRGPEAISWSRRLGSKSDAKIVLPPGTMKDLRRLAAHPRRHQLAIWRHEDREPTWIGPCTQVDEGDQAVTIQAEDLLAWPEHRSLPALVRPIIGDVTDVAEAIFEASLDRTDDPIQHRRRFERTGVSATVPKWTGNRPYASSELRRLTASTLSLTACGLTIYGWASESDREPSFVVPTSDLGTSPLVSSSAINSASIVIARSGSLVAQWPPPGLVDEFDGVDEIVLDARSIRDIGELTEYAKAQWSVRRWPEITVGIASGVTVPPTFPVPMEQMIPGLRVGTESPQSRNLVVSGIFELARLDVSIGTPAGEAPRDAATGRFVTAGATAIETISASWSPVPGKVTL